MMANNKGMPIAQEGHRALTVRLQDTTHKRLRVMCADLDVSMQEILSACVESVLDAYGEQGGDAVLAELGIE